MSLTFSFLLFSFLFLMWAVQSVTLVENQHAEEGQQTWITAHRSHSHRGLWLYSHRSSTQLDGGNSPRRPTSGLSLCFLCADFFSSRFFFESQKVQGKNVNLLAFEAGLPGDDGLCGDDLWPGNTYGDEPQTVATS